ncbi:MAG: 3-hydroxyacyl-CoA dehydrogenase / enoyl-CoA hydratase / 3-hydroxybutyryl-CoA epimerase [Gammaproteobacteria bacterium]|jgi:3-hydroxyacyl-CoA dehydrogenase/enoyl-CoA hydratase/3-hydroxybutyryl-CoA epimerase|nr:3-hydroxyacyl-CoA dehydrogenase / enoyl-CoA hydratase / 3-hydroxybutyryl-CoA epimerase [Gammaproteobacteria bacterium]
MSYSNWSLQIDADRIAWLTCDMAEASTNVLSAAVVRELALVLAEIRTLRPVGMVVQSAKPSGFIAGADIKEFVKIRTPAEGYLLVRAAQSVLQELEDLPFPSVAALRGFALGGGLELALACTYRIGADDPALSLGLPEVMLGIHPGFGGTVRSVRTVGVRAALELMLKGRPFRAQRALSVGLLDGLVPPNELATRAKALLLRHPARKSAPLVDKLMNLGAVRPFVAKQTIATLRRSVRREHYPAPYAIVELWQQHGANGAAAYEAEARSISELMCTSTSRNLVRVFLLQDRLKSLGGESSVEFKHVHVVGAGVMGGDIAAWAAFRGMTVTLQDRNEELIRPALRRAQSFFEKRLKDPAAAADAASRLTMDVKGDGAAKADVVIEAIFEDVDAKQALYAELEPQLKPTAVLATNTSSIRIEILCRKLADPSRLVGIHFFNPVAQLQLVEVVQGANTRARVLHDALKFTRKLDKLPLPCKSAPGFVVNRILTPYINEALYALEAGISAVVIDRAAERFGMPMGPIELTDVVGLDVSLHVGQVLSEAFHREVPQILIRLVDQKKLGRKSGEGFYRWQDGKALKPEAEQAEPPDLEDRLILAMLNEAVACLREGTVEDADLLDAGAVFATGFAPFRGGPLQYARDRGIVDVTSRLNELADRYGERFRPDAGWSSLPA